MPFSYTTPLNSKVNVKKLMPTYLGKGRDFHLIMCELMPSPNASKEEKLKIIAETCHKCGFYRDAFARQQQAQLDGQPWRKLVCIHPKNQAAFDRIKGHVTEWSSAVKHSYPHR